MRSRSYFTGEIATTSCVTRVRPRRHTGVKGRHDIPMRREGDMGAHTALYCNG